MGSVTPQFAPDVKPADVLLPPLEENIKKSFQTMTTFISILHDVVAEVRDVVQTQHAVQVKDMEERMNEHTNEVMNNLSQEFAKTVQYAVTKFSEHDAAILYIHDKTNDTNVKLHEVVLYCDEIYDFSCQNETLMRSIISAAELKTKQEEELKAKQEADLKAKQEADLKAKQDEELKAQEETKAKAQEETTAKALQEAAELKAKKEEEAADLKAVEDKAAEAAAKEEADTQATLLAAEIQALAVAEAETEAKAQELLVVEAHIQSLEVADAKANALFVERATLHAAQAGEIARLAALIELNVTSADTKAEAQLEEDDDFFHEPEEAQELSAVELKQKLRQAALEDMLTNY